MIRPIVSGFCALCWLPPCGTTYHIHHPPSTSLRRSRYSALTIDRSLAIKGPGAPLLTISGNHLTSVFSMTGAIIATVSGVTIENGNTNADGGAITNGPASTLTIANSTLGNLPSWLAALIFNAGHADRRPQHPLRELRWRGRRHLQQGGALICHPQHHLRNAAFEGGGGIFSDGGTGERHRQHASAGPAGQEVRIEDVDGATVSIVNTTL